MWPQNAVCLRLALTLALCLPVLSVGSACTARPVPRADRCDYGITLAMSGNLSRAESVFVSLLAPGRGDARALNNLGNLQLLRGETEVALAFYERALQSDSSDAGIRLNLSVALMILGREDESRAEAEAGVRQAGGLKAATALLGLHAEDSTTTTSRGAEASRVSREEVQALLAAAARAVPRDSTARSSAPASAGKPSRRRASEWRSGGPRAAEESEVRTVLYWKR